MLPAHLIDRLESLCLEAGRVETGGILVGVYTEELDCAIVTGVSGPPRDSRGGPAWFIRGVYGLQRWLDGLWKKERHYFLGDWHFHPGAVPEPSAQDIRQTEEIALSPKYMCPEPILLIVGGDPPEVLHPGAFVYVIGKGIIPLPRTLE